MIKPSGNELRHASQISVVRQDIENFLSQMISEGRPLSAEAEARFYYLGLTGFESMERITEDSFYGRDDENPRQPGYYAVEIVRLNDGRSCTAKPFYAVYRDQNQQVGPQRDRTVEGGYGDLMEEYRILNAQLKREVQDQIRKNNQLQTELDTFSNAFNKLRKENIALEIERDKAVRDAERMEHEKAVVVDRCNELESEAASFRPQIDQMVDGLVEKVGPQVQQMFMAMGGEAFGTDGGGGEEGSSDGAKKKKPKPPWSGGGGASADDGSGGGASPSPAHPGGVVPGAAAKGRPVPMSDDPEMPTPEFLSYALYYLFWEFEQFGRFVHLVQKGDDGNPLVPWYVIRGIVFYHSGTDLGPKPIWPSEVQGVQGEPQEDAGEKTSSANGATARNGVANRKSSRSADRVSSVGGPGSDLRPTVVDMREDDPSGDADVDPGDASEDGPMDDPSDDRGGVPFNDDPRGPRARGPENEQPEEG